MRLLSPMVKAPSTFAPAPTTTLFPSVGWRFSRRRLVPPNSVVVGVPGRVTYKDGQRVGDIDLNQIDLPDPVTKALEQLVERIRSLEAELETLRKTVDKEERP